MNSEVSPENPTIKNLTENAHLECNNKIEAKSTHEDNFKSENEIKTRKEVSCNNKGYKISSLESMKLPEKEKFVESSKFEVESQKTNEKYIQEIKTEIFEKPKNESCNQTLVQVSEKENQQIRELTNSSLTGVSEKENNEKITNQSLAGVFEKAKNDESTNQTLVQVSEKENNEEITNQSYADVSEKENNDESTKQSFSDVSEKENNDEFTKQSFSDVSEKENNDEFTIQSFSDVSEKENNDDSTNQTLADVSEKESKVKIVKKISIQFLEKKTKVETENEISTEFLENESNSSSSVELSEKTIDETSGEEFRKKFYKDENSEDSVTNILLRPHFETESSRQLRSLCKKGEIKELRQFLEDKPSDCDLNSLSEEGWSPLHEIISHECQFVEIAGLLLEFGASVNTQDGNGDSPLHASLLYHNVSNVRLLLQYGADLNLVNFGGRYPIHVADDVETLEMLLAQSSSIDVQDSLGYSPLHFAVISKDVDRVRVLLKHNCDVNIQNNAGSTPLHLTNGDYDIARLLLEHSADPNIRDMNDNTPLHLASRGRHKDIVRLLLKKNANPSIQNNNRKTAFNLAKDKEMKQIFSGTGDKIEFSHPPVAVKRKASVIIVDKTLTPNTSCTRGILKRSHCSNNYDIKKKEGSRLTFSSVVDYNCFESFSTEKRIKIPPVYIEPTFSSDED